MITVFARVISIIFIATTSICQAQSISNFQCDKQDAKAIDTISKDYLVSHSIFNARDLVVSSQYCMATHASARIKLGKYSNVRAPVYLHKVDNQWQVILLGSTPEDPILKNVPMELRAVTQRA
jgi:hypothetical protein